MKKINYIKLLFSLIVLTFIGCQENEYTFGEIIAPTNIVITSDIVGADDANPNGDGSGIVNFSVTGKDVISYVYYFDGAAVASPSGILTKRFSKVGVNTYTIVVKANGRGGVSSTATVQIEVYSSFSDVKAENLLSGVNVGDSKKWYWQANVGTHVGLGPVTDDYGNGEFAYEAWWNTIGPWDEEKSCMYDNEFVFTRTADGITFEQTAGPAFVPGAYAEQIGVDGDRCHDETVATNMFGVKNVAFAPSESKAALEGSYNEKPYRKTTFEISDGGFMGWFVGSGTYDIISITEDELLVRVIQAGDGFAWYHKFTSTKPVEETVVTAYNYNTLVWEDDFNTDGTPDAAKWTYDTGAGGWGNNEVQSYTSNAENVTVKDGVLKITAKADGNGGYTSARLKTQGLYGFTYGKVEVRAKLPAGGGTWPAIWMLGENFNTVGWPACGEIDIMEHTGNDIGKVSSALHTPSSHGNTVNVKSTTVNDATTEFHTYTVNWTPDKIEFSVDDTIFYTYNPETKDADNWPYDANQFLILNIAMGGTLGGTIDPAFTESTMEIDSIKVFQ